ncbi:MAG TPA: hypothetical protein VFJ17_07630 [Mycobacteriales bacterium]|jgi:large-conductance mechanosensitive channel|nr:hypothetical protein [Mycobacteriales bacterium]
MTRTDQGPSRTGYAAAIVIGVALGAVVATLTSDVILGVIAGAPCVAIIVGLQRLWTGGGTTRPHAP